MPNPTSKSKVQTAVRFLKGYGWVILTAQLIVTALLSVLIYFGTSSPSTLVPEKCTFPSSLTCIDHFETTSKIALTILNNAGSDMTITKASAASQALGTGDLGCGCSTGATATELKNGQSTTLTLATPDANCSNGCNYKDTGRDSNIYKLTVFYHLDDSPSISHQLNGEMLTRSPGPVSLVSPVSEVPSIKEVIDMVISILMIFLITTVLFLPLWIGLTLFYAYSGKQPKLIYVVTVTGAYLLLVIILPYFGVL